MPAGTRAGPIGPETSRCPGPAIEVDTKETRGGERSNEMARSRKAEADGRRWVGDSRGRRGRNRRLGIEWLEGRLCLSATPPTWASIGPAPITDPFQQNLDTQYVNPPEITGAVQAMVTFKTSQGVGAYVGAPLGGV
jgi:hypothetical protein